jgi:hypothetical protein
MSVASSSLTADIIAASTKRFERGSTLQKRKLLALDGGGIRGVLSLGILAKIEQIIGKPLGDYFDYIGGTSTGAIIATGLSLGFSVAKLQQFYDDCGPLMFEPRCLLQRYKSLYASDPLKDKLMEAFGAARTLGSADLKPKLLIMTRNWTTDSPWPVSNNPKAKYNDLNRPDCNLNIPLWQLVRASTAAPIYFPPEVLNWAPNDPSKSFAFVDGGVTPYNNPAFQMYRMATLPHYHLEWESGEDNMLIISVGTGSAPTAGPNYQSPDRSIPSQIPGLISALMYAAEVDQDINCRAIGRCVFGNKIDRELGDMVYTNPEPKKAFRYARYNAELTGEGLDALQLAHFKPNLDDLLKMDLATPENIARLREIGTAVGALVQPTHFGAFLV